MMYGMKRTTIYLPDEMKTSIEREAVRRGVTEAEVIRGAVRATLADIGAPVPHLPLFDEPLGFDLAVLSRGTG